MASSGSGCNGPSVALVHCVRPGGRRASNPWALSRCSKWAIVCSRFSLTTDCMVRSWRVFCSAVCAWSYARKAEKNWKKNRTFILWILPSSTRVSARSLWLCCRSSSTSQNTVQELRATKRWRSCWKFSILESAWTISSQELKTRIKPSISESIWKTFFRTDLTVDPTGICLRVPLYGFGGGSSSSLLLCRSTETPGSSTCVAVGSGCGLHGSTKSASSSKLSILKRKAARSARNPATNPRRKITEKVQLCLQQRRDVNKSAATAAPRAAMAMHTRKTQVEIVMVLTWACSTGALEFQLDLTHATQKFQHGFCRIIFND